MLEYPSLECKLDDFAGKTNRFKLQIQDVIIISVCLQPEIHYMRESHTTALRTGCVTVIFSSDTSVLQRYGEYNLKILDFVSSVVF